MIALAPLALAPLALFALFAMLQAGTAPPQREVQMGVAVRPDTVTVGEPFLVTLRARAPRGATIVFPVGPDSSANSELVDPRVLRTNPDSAAVDQSASYRLVAWDTGRVLPKFADIRVTIGGVQRVLFVGGVRIHVRSVLPADTALRVPKLARDIVPATRPWWWWWPIAVAVLAAIGLIWLLLWWLRRRRRSGDGVDEDALVVAERQFARIDGLGLVEAGERGRFVALYVDVLREYLASRVRAASRSLTSTELLAQMRDERVVPVARLAPILAEADLIKFARRPVTADHARQIAQETRGIVRDVDASVKAAEAAEAEEAKRQEAKRQAAAPERAA